MDNFQILDKNERLVALLDNMRDGLVEIDGNELMHITEKGVHVAYAKLREHPVTERLLFVLLLKALEEVQELLNTEDEGI